MNVAYKDLREWLAHVEETGELRRVKGVGLEEDVGRIAELSASTDQGPALLMYEFSGYEKGHGLLLNPFGTTRMIALHVRLSSRDRSPQAAPAFQRPHGKDRAAASEIR